MPITTKILSNWKNFVLNFRRDFDSKHSRAQNTDSLSLLIYALAAISVSKQSRGNDRHGKNPKQRGATAFNLSRTIEFSEYLFDSTKSALPEGLSYELTNSVSKYANDFAIILDEIDAQNITGERFILPYTYQYWRDSDRKIAQREIQSADKKIDREKLIAFTQIYTPDWVVDFVLANTILCQLEESLVLKSTLTPYLVPAKAQHVLAPTDITLIDPACGAGNFVISAFDLLLETWERQHRGGSSGNSPTHAIKSIIKNQLHACDIDPIALSVAATALATRCLQNGVDTVPTLAGLALSVPSENEILGSLAPSFPKAHPLSKTFHAVVTNPPYIGRKLISRELKTLLKRHYPASHQDLSAAFFERCLSLLKPTGRAGLITQASVMFLPSYAKLRDLLLQDYQLITAIDAGPGVFPLQGGEKVNSAILITGKPDATICGETFFFNLKSQPNKSEELKRQISDNTCTRRLDQNTFHQFHGSAFNYHIPPAIARLLKTSPQLSEFADIRQGLATSDNDRFVKYAWEIEREELGRIWFPYVKGAGGSRYYSPVKHVVNWQNDGAEIKEEVNRRYPYLKGKTAWVVKNESFYFQEGLCFSFVNTRGIALRQLPANCIFDVGASAIFSEDCDFLLAYLNSSLMVALANSLNPTINYQVGDVKRFPAVRFDSQVKARLQELALKCIALQQRIRENVDPAAWFDPCRDWSNMPFTNIRQNDFATEADRFTKLLGELHRELRSTEEEIDQLVLSSTSANERWTVAEQKEVYHWIDEYNSRTSNEVTERLPVLLLNNILLTKMLKTGGNSSFASMDMITGDIDILENLIGSRFQSYLDTTFQPYVNKCFHGRPPKWLLAIDAIRECFLT